MRAGQLRHRIKIQKQKPIVGEHGQNVGCYQTLYDGIHASIVTLTGRELELAHEILATATHTVKCRYLSGVDETCQIIWDCRTLGIGAVMVGDRTNDNRKLGLTMICTEIKAN